MCGIVGYVGPKRAAPILVRGLRDLEYRGYDSAGIAVLSADGGGAPLSITKREGKIANLEAALDAADPLTATTGIGHTRWATHGAPSDRNAHPHPSCGHEVVVIHNGIVENYAALRAELGALGHVFESDTDTETVAHLMEDAIKAEATLLDALKTAAARLTGSQAIVAMSPREPGVLVAARIGNAGGVVIGCGDGEMFLASDLAAVLPHTQQVAYLADGQFARIEATGLRIVEGDDSEVTVDVRTVAIDPESAMKGDFPHFMLKEIMEQPQALLDTVQSLVTVEPPDLRMPDLAEVEERLRSVNRVVLIGMGTSLHAAMIGRAYIELLSGLPAEVDNASEFRYRSPVIDSNTLVISMSQSGETVDVLEAMAVAKASGAALVTVCNTEGAQTTRVADGTVYTRAGLERGVASTKCFTAAVAALYVLALKLGQIRGRLNADDLRGHIRDVLDVPAAVSKALRNDSRYLGVAERLGSAEHMLLLGRGLAFPVAMEGALKMKEISYVHAEGYAAGEMKHGPIALIDEKFPVIAVVTRHALREKLISNIQQVQARSGPVVAICTEGDAQIAELVPDTVTVPEVSALLEPIVATIPLQLLAYHSALLRGCDVDQPRNLAKTVTVE